MPRGLNALRGSMRLCALVLGLLLSSIAAPPTVDAQRQEKLYRIGVLERTSTAVNAANLDGFRQGLRDLGYVEGKNFVIEYRLPAIYASMDFAGGLAVYGLNYPDHYRRAAGFADKILKGATPADLPVELPTKLDLVINTRTAKALGLTVPSSLLLQADQVVQ